MGSQSVTLQDLQAPGPVQGSIRLVQVQEYHVQDLLTQGRYVLKQLGLGGGGICAATRPKYVEKVVEGDGDREPAI